MTLIEVSQILARRFRAISNGVRFSFRAGSNSLWIGVIAFVTMVPGSPHIARAETAAERASRHEQVAKRRAGVPIIAHRGALEFFHENTIEAYRATFELGADGNEIDIRRTSDGVLVCFHDDMLDHLLEAFGTVEETTWNELHGFRFRRPGRLGASCLIPTLRATFELHRRTAGLLHLDVKRPKLEPAIAALLDEFDLWDHVVAVNTDNAAALVADPRCKLLRYKGGLYLDRSEVFPDLIAAVLKRPGEMVILEDPRGVLHALGRKIGSPSLKPADPDPIVVRRLSPAGRTVHGMVQILNEDTGWNQVAKSEEERAASAAAIRRRADAAEYFRRPHLKSGPVVAALEKRVRRRSLHSDWLYHGLDSASALRALIEIDAPSAVELARFALWRDDPDVEAARNPKYDVPRSWTDFRDKTTAFEALEGKSLPGIEQLCRDYLALSDEDARRIGPLQFEAAARTLLAAAPNANTAAELVRHRLTAVRGRAVLFCLSRKAEPWASAVLREHAPFALEYSP